MGEGGGAGGGGGKKYSWLSSSQIMITQITADFKLIKDILMHSRM